MSAAVGSAVVVAATALGWIAHRDALSGITTSQALSQVLGDAPVGTGGDQNILIMGVDSRRDQQGRPLPADIYGALHAGDETTGDYDADVLIVVRMPADGGPVTAVSVPRDDYVDLAGCPGSECEGKVKHAYSLAYHRVLDGGGADTHARSHPATNEVNDPTALEQPAREAGRQAEIQTVRALLDIPIDHFVEITLAAFLQIARVIQPITVCLNNDTSDSYSGANFHKGVQQIDAAQAMAFVRQRRDINDESFTDLDRTRRQQAFIASLLNALGHSGAFTNPTALNRLLDVAKQNVAVDAGWDLQGLMRHTSALTDRPPVLYTLPVSEFRQLPDGEDVNMIDVSTIRATVHTVLAAGSSPASASTANADALAQRGTDSQTGTPNMVLNVINAAGRDGVAAIAENRFATGKFVPGSVTTADSISPTSAIEYGPGAESAANALAGELNLTANPSSTVAADNVQLTIGADISRNDYLQNRSTKSSATTTTTTTSTVATVAATGTQGPAPTDLTRMTADGIPCVR
ncbi:MAG TPA: LCP family protein [Mycobacterium sp.]|nr:LCP family protein [Mycobacterium sp.]HZA09181.1 LCP family protein [Mycobacterium sp.]